MCRLTFAEEERALLLSNFYSKKAGEASLNRASLVGALRSMRNPPGPEHDPRRIVRCHLACCTHSRDHGR